MKTFKKPLLLLISLILAFSVAIFTACEDDEEFPLLTDHFQTVKAQTFKLKDTYTGDKASYALSDIQSKALPTFEVAKFADSEANNAMTADTYGYIYFKPKNDMKLLGFGFNLYNDEATSITITVKFHNDATMIALREKTVTVASKATEYIEFTWEEAISVNKEPVNSAVDNGLLITINVNTVVNAVYNISLDTVAFRIPKEEK